MEQIADLTKVHSSTMDSVNLITSILAGATSTTNEEVIARNLAHIRIIQGKYEWSEAELAPFLATISAAAQKYPSLATEEGTLARLSALQDASGA